MDDAVKVLKTQKYFDGTEPPVECSGFGNEYLVESVALNAVKRRELAKAVLEKRAMRFCGLTTVAWLELSEEEQAQRRAEFQAHVQRERPAWSEDFPAEVLSA